MVIVQEAPKSAGFAAELIALINEHALLSLEAPIVRVTGWDTPFPYTLDLEYLPSADRVLQGMRKTLNF
ncbi:2-oxoisovalerate dehydrogenase subunit beta [compost metagenome]